MLRWLSGAGVFQGLPCLLWAWCAGCVFPFSLSSPCGLRGAERCALPVVFPLLIGGGLLVCSRPSVAPCVLPCCSGGLLSWACLPPWSVPCGFPAPAVVCAATLVFNSISSQQTKQIDSTATVSYRRRAKLHYCTIPLPHSSYLSSPQYLQNHHGNRIQQNLIKTPSEPPPNKCFSPAALAAAAVAAAAA